jgi:hypothetical protein
VIRVQPNRHAGVLCPAEFKEAAFYKRKSTMKAPRIAIALAAIPALLVTAGCVATVPSGPDRVVVHEHPRVVERPVVVERPAPAVVVRP